jgi:predicted metal-dependent hydrolase
MSAITRSINYGEEIIAFEVSFSQRKTLDICVHPNQKIIVKAPVDALLEESDRRVKKHAYWILKQQQYFSQFQTGTPIRQYISGETHLYLGRQYRLKVEINLQPSVKLMRETNPIQNYRRKLISRLAAFCALSIADCKDC